jgi:hypothetical protein
MRVACVHCTEHVHSARAHRALVRLGHVLVHGQRVVNDQPVVVQNALHNQEIERIECVTRTVNDSDTIEWLQDQRVNAVDQGMTKARQGKDRPSDPGTGKEGDRMRTPPITGAILDPPRSAPAEGGSVGRVAQ